MESAKECRVSKDRRHNPRFSRIALQALKEWFRSHWNDPYPNDDEKAALGRLTGLRDEQINTWFANARRRRKGGSFNPAAPSSKVRKCQPQNGHGGSTSNGPADGDNNQTTTLPQTPPDSGFARRIYQCTFCTDTFKSKYDWTRHEASLHLSLRRYICCPFPATIEDPTSRSVTCAYCSAPDPTTEHIETHNHTDCQERDPEARTFFRKDHLRQHLRSVHECELLPHMNTWVLEAVFVNSRCGFCGRRFTVWSERNDHIAGHFREGFQMEQWKGCRGLDAAISAEVTTAMPPFLIGIERSSPNPFSASSKKYAFASAKPTSLSDPNVNQVSSWELLAIELHNLTKRRSIEGFAVSDEALQRHARAVIHGSGDSRATTAADNPEWLDLFKKAHSLGVIPDSIGQDAETIPGDLEAYQDLGLRMPASVQKERHGAWIALFLNDRPSPKNYPRFSSLFVPPEKALLFETIAGPWPDSGVLGDIIVTRDWLFCITLQAQFKGPVFRAPVRVVEEESEVECDELDISDPARIGWRDDS